ncbi:MAG: glutathione peroxidase [Bacteroidales bacterium]
MISSSAAYGQKNASTTFHDFQVETITGEQLDLSSFEGKKVMVVNTASKCGFTPQYEVLEELYQKYADQGFVVIGFPANNFNNQEPGTDEEIMEFCQNTFQVTFPMMSKISVKGEDQAPLYRWLTNKEYNGKVDAEVAWNFQKFLIDEQGQLVDFLPPRESPMSERVIRWIEEE